MWLINFTYFRNVDRFFLSASFYNAILHLEKRKVYILYCDDQTFGDSPIGACRPYKL